jgi:hypothetical protein
MWDGAAAMDSIFAGGVKLGVIIKASFVDWVLLWNELDIIGPDRFIPSMKQFQTMEKLTGNAMRAHPAYGANVELLKTVHQFSTRAFIALLIEWGSVNRGAIRRKAKTCLLCVLDEFCISDDFRTRVDPGTHAQPCAASNECSEDLSADGLCSHLRNAGCATLSQGVRHNPELVELLVDLRDDLLDCDRCSAFLKLLLIAVSDSIESGLADMEDHDPTKHCFKNTKRRGDEDLRNHLMNTMVRDGKVASSAAGVRSEYGATGTKKARYWLHGMP